jgi:hypothetical protein
MQHPQRLRAKPSREPLGGSRNTLTPTSTPWRPSAQHAHAGVLALGATVTFQTERAAHNLDRCELLFQQHRYRTGRPLELGRLSTADMYRTYSGSGSSVTADRSHTQALATSHVSYQPDASCPCRRAF